jgi:hypothetical protein
VGQPRNSHPVTCSEEQTTVTDLVDDADDFMTWND